jgi:hypothetical protein
MKPLNRCTFCEKPILPYWKTCNECDQPAKTRLKRYKGEYADLLVLEKPEEYYYVRKTDIDEVCIAEKKIIDLEDRLQDAMILLTKYQHHFLK